MLHLWDEEQNKLISFRQLKRKGSMEYLDKRTYNCPNYPGNLRGNLS